ncbi:DUF4783 domain-containing protein [Marinilabiliaceae bacterium JC017]|nr:DUF4783 domain-containing protein [Marinilabiliaceae bacterium JC017]
MQLLKYKFRHMKIFRTVFMMMLLLLSVSGLPSQSSSNFPEAITNATRKGDAKTLASYFNSSIELVLPGKSGVFSKSQAEMIVKEFFSQNPPQQFRIIHKGMRSNASFAIGSYETPSGKYRFYFLTKETNNKALIHQLRIERQDD